MTFMFDLADPDLPLVSIIIPVYNGSDWMGAAIDSALAQTYPNIEVIVVNDGSTDGGSTAQIAEAYGAKIRYIHQANGGVGAALNTGIAAMRGTYFSWLSHDDAYLPRKIETQMRKMAEFAEPVVIFGNVSLIDDQSRLIEDADFATKVRPDDEAFWNILGVLLSGCSLLIPKLCFDTCGVFNPALPTTQDYDLWFRLAQRYRFVVTPEYLTLSRQHEGQGSRAIGHLDEVAFMFMRFINELPDLLRSRAPADLLAVASRAGDLPVAKWFPAIGILIERWKHEIRAQSKPLLVSPADRFQDGLLARARLEALGFATADLVFIRHGQDAALRNFAVSDAVMRRQGSIISVPGEAGPSTIAAAVAKIAAPDQIVVFWDESRLADPSCLEISLDSVLGLGIEAILAVEDPSDRSLDGLIVLGSALRRQAQEGDMTGWMQGLPRAELAVSPPPSSSTVPDPSAAPTPPTLSRTKPVEQESRRRSTVPRLLRANTWSAEKNRVRARILREFISGLGWMSPRHPATAHLSHDISPSTDVPREEVPLASATIPAPIEVETVRTSTNAELLVLAGQSTEARDWARHLDRVLKSRIKRMFGHADADGRLVLTSTRPPIKEVFLLPADMKAAVDYLRSCGIRRLDIVGTDQLPLMEQLIEELALPIDVTVLMHGKDEVCIPEEFLLRNAQRIHAPIGSLAGGLAATAGSRLRQLPVPGAREARAFHVSTPAVRAGEALRVLALSMVRRDSDCDDLQCVADLLRKSRLPIHLSAAGESGTTDVFTDLHWLGPYDDRSLTGYIGATAPHLLWVVLDPNAAVAPCLLDAMWTGLPMLVTGPTNAAALIEGREKSMFIRSADAEAVARWLGAFYEGNASYAEPRADRAVVEAFDTEAYLDWR